jgi:hypothetical protein
VECILDVCHGPGPISDLICDFYHNKGAMTI